MCERLVHSLIMMFLDVPSFTHSDLHCVCGLCLVLMM